MLSKKQKKVKGFELTDELMQQYANCGVNVVGFEKQPSRAEIAEERYHRVLTMVLCAELVSICVIACNGGFQ